MLAVSEEVQFSLTPTTSTNSVQLFEYKLSCGADEYTVIGTCRSKKDGQQLGAQALLKVSTRCLVHWSEL